MRTAFICRAAVAGILGLVLLSPTMVAQGDVDAPPGKTISITVELTLFGQPPPKQSFDVVTIHPGSDAGSIQTFCGGWGGYEHREASRACIPGVYRILERESQGETQRFIFQRYTGRVSEVTYDSAETFFRHDDAMLEDSVFQVYYDFDSGRGGYLADRRKKGEHVPPRLPDTGGGDAAGGGPRIGGLAPAALRIAALYASARRQ